MKAIKSVFGKTRQYTVHNVQSTKYLTNRKDHDDKPIGLLMTSFRDDSFLETQNSATPSRRLTRSRKYFRPMMKQMLGAPTNDQF